MANIFIATRNKLQRKMPEMGLVLFVTKRLHGFPWFSMVFHGFVYLTKVLERVKGICYKAYSSVMKETEMMFVKPLASILPTMKTVFRSLVEPSPSRELS
jgi:hypothetical protein